jgi:23S rRNA pseudouridine1911/1915/1917 synthase
MVDPSHPLTPRILLEDNHCLALNKPAPLLTQSASPDIPSLEAAARDYLRAKYHKTGRVYLGVPHRLDRPVTGVLLLARSTKAAQRLTEQFQQRQVTKRYLALVEGDVQPDEGEWTDWLLKATGEARAECVSAETPGAKSAVLSYRVKKRFAGYTLLEVEPKTGRSHQIRVQAASRGWPVLGDALYGAKTAFGPPAELERDRVIALHALSLTFLHPIRYEPVEVIAPLPDYWPALEG